jgi:hypothetical protein
MCCGVPGSVMAEPCQYCKLPQDRTCYSRQWETTDVSARSFMQYSTHGTGASACSCVVTADMMTNLCALQRTMHNHYTGVLQLTQVRLAVVGVMSAVLNSSIHGVRHHKDLCCAGGCRNHCFGSVGGAHLVLQCGTKAAARLIQLL